MDREKLKDEIKRILKEKYSDWCNDEYEFERLAEDLSRFDNILEKLRKGYIFDEWEARGIYMDEILEELNDEIERILKVILEFEMRSGKLIERSIGGRKIYIRIKR